MESYEKLFFEILQNGLWGKPIEAVPTRNDMLHVVKLALSQTVLGIVGNVIITDKTLSSYLTERTRISEKVGDECRVSVLHMELLSPQYFHGDA